ncbi:MAG: reverse transcriptase/maturase family protein [Patescibacteria group bacterium]
MKFYTNIFEQIISLDNLFLAWDEFKKGKLKKKDVLEFEWNLEENTLELHRNLKYHTYKHGVYYSFFITDPKLREIHKATVVDRVLHHAIFRVFNPIFEPTFISSSFSCRISKGNHKGVDCLAKFIRQVSKNNTGPCYVLKCDIKKFFDSIDHEILLNIIQKRISDQNTMRLLSGIIGSYSKTVPLQLGLFERERESNSAGLPIGNLTSQLFANIYMNEFDQFIKHKLKIRHYARYTDDFVIVSNDHAYLESLIPEIQFFLEINLKLKLHPNKVSIRKIRQGIDFLGYVVFPNHRLLRTKTKRRIFAKLRKRVAEFKAGLISRNVLDQSLNSYLGALSHASTHELQEELKNQFWFWLNE